MAKRSKKKNPNLLTESQKADIRFNESLDIKKKELDIRLNITMGIVVGLCLLAFLVMPAVNMNFSGSLSDILGSQVELEEDTQMSVTVNMSFIDFLTAPAGGYENALRYLAEHTDSDINVDLIYAAFQSQVTPDETEMLGQAYTVALAGTVILLISLIVFTVAVAVMRHNKKDGLFLILSSTLFIAIGIIQWIIFLAVGLGASSKGLIQPHIAAYIVLAAAVTLAVVYGLYRKKVKRLNSQRRQVPSASDKVENNI